MWGGVTTAGQLGGKIMMAGVALVAVAIACVQTVFPLGPPNGSASEVIGPTGGLIATDEGTTVIVPPNALDASVTIAVALNASAPPLTQARSLTTAHVLTPEGQTFGVPVCVTLSYEPELLPAGMTGQNVFLYSAPQDSGDYQPVPSLAVDPTHVMGMTTHFSNVFAAYGGEGGQELPLDAGCVLLDAGDGGDGGT
jgi:hypothetical protein